jgi:hypothetical protein
MLIKHLNDENANLVEILAKIQKTTTTTTTKVTSGFNFRPYYKNKLQKSNKTFTRI